MTDQAELKRKAVHIAFGLCAILLHWLTWQQAAGVALAALAFNRFVLPVAGGRSITRGGRGYDRGILLYPLSVLVLILVFRHRLEIAGAVWAILAFGDGFATVAGRLAGGPRLPWNREKSWAGLAAFLLCGFLSAYSVWALIAREPTAIPVVAIVALGVAVSALVESLPLRLDDNMTVPLAGALSIFALATATHWPAATVGRVELVWLAVNLVLAAPGFAAKSVDLSGAIGGAILGAVIILFGGWQLYLVLLLFFVIGTGATRLGYSKKKGLGLAQEKEGRRGFGHAFSNVGVAATLAAVGSMHPESYALFWVAAAASLATAAADTGGSEVGQWLGRTAFLPLSLRRVPPGTEGAISWEGTSASLAAGTLTAAVAAFLYGLRGAAGGIGTVFVVVAIAAFAGAYLESIAGNWNRRSGSEVPNGVLNFFNTSAGAAIAALLTQM